MKAKHSRQELLVKIVQSHRIKSQEELKNILLESNIDVAQATLSRDLRELGIVKSHDADGYFFTLPGTKRQEVKEKPMPVFTTHEGITMTSNGSIIVLKVKPGYAGMVAARIDGHSAAGILGTVAGDDTILVVLRKGFGVRRMAALLKEIFPDVPLKTK